MNIILLQPTDVLFFRDGRPMTGSLAGHTAAWPLPDVTNHALHAALHRADLGGVHPHDHHQRDGSRLTNARKFGSLLTAGPFPVRVSKSSTGDSSDETWFFPRPKDTQENGTVRVTLRPARGDWRTNSSLPNPLSLAVANTDPPDKDAGGEPWLSAEAFKVYLQDSRMSPETVFAPSNGALLRDEALVDYEANLGIAIDPETQTTGQGSTEGKIYTAHYLRLRDAFRLGLLAKTEDRDFQQHDGDLIKALLNSHPRQIIVGGQQRICTAERKDANGALPLPRGCSGGFNTCGESNEKRWLVKWILLSPAVWPEIPAKKKNGSDQNSHPGGWLPNWVFVKWNTETRESEPDERNGEVLLTAGLGVQKAARKGANAGAKISGRLVAALVPKPLIVTGWALSNEADRPKGGAKSTHLAVSAGAIYYFEAYSEKDATALATALNWHGATDGTEIKNRRSTLMGEKGFGLGVCGTWGFYGD